MRSRRGGRELRRSLDVTNVVNDSTMLTAITHSTNTGILLNYHQSVELLILKGIILPRLCTESFHALYVGRSMGPQLIG